MLGAETLGRGAPPAATVAWTGALRGRLPHSPDPDGAPPRAAAQPAGPAGAERGARARLRQHPRRMFHVPHRPVRQPAVRGAAAQGRRARRVRQPQPVYLLGQCARHAPAPSPCMRPRQHASTGSMTDMVRLIYARHTPSALTDPGPVRCPRSAAATATAAHHACMSAARQTSSRGTQWLRADRRLRPPSRRCSATASSRSREALHRCDAAGAGALSRRPGRAGALHNALPLRAGDRGSSGHGAAAGVLRVSCAAGVPALPASPTAGGAGTLSI